MRPRLRKRLGGKDIAWALDVAEGRGSETATPKAALIWGWGLGIGERHGALSAQGRPWPRTARAPPIRKPKAQSPRAHATDGQVEAHSALGAKTTEVTLDAPLSSICKVTASCGAIETRVLRGA